MISRTKFIILAALIPVLIGIAWGIDRIFTNLQCWEDSVQSPRQICSESDYLALATLVRVRTIANINYLLVASDSVNEYVVEATYRTVSCVKGYSDSVALWDIVSSSGVEDWMSRTGETTFVYGSRIPAADSIPNMILRRMPTYWESASTALRNSTELKQAFNELRGQMPVVFFPDGGPISWKIHYGGLCYYDETRTARSVSAQTYWKEVVKYMDSDR